MPHSQEQREQQRDLDAVAGVSGAAQVSSLTMSLIARYTMNPITTVPSTV
jgi:hypothetical protein